jgi:hypothetical protein
MKHSGRIAVLVLIAVVFGSSASIFLCNVSGQEEGWQIVRADYGFRNQRNDVTDIVKDLIERGGVNGKVAITNQTMGGDPAIGADKSLRIFARNRRHEEREFDYKEGSLVEARLFNLRVDDWDDRPSTPGGRDHDRGRDRDDGNGVQLIRAYYGVQGRTVNVTDLLRSRLREGRLAMVVTNSSLGGDPAVGYDKVLIVIYKFQGKETAAAVHEGNTLTLP